jgi:hypothetical protein
LNCVHPAGPHFASIPGRGSRASRSSPGKEQALPSPGENCLLEHSSTRQSGATLSRALSQSAAFLARCGLCISGAALACLAAPLPRSISHHPPAPISSASHYLLPLQIAGRPPEVHPLPFLYFCDLSPTRACVLTSCPVVHDCVGQHLGTPRAHTNFLRLAQSEPGPRRGPD